jgi:XamI restriction endonuclease
MHISNSKNPQLWSVDELAEQAQIALNEFVDRRLAESRDAYSEHFSRHRITLLALFKALSKINPVKPDVDALREILLDDELYSALRYVGGPPISEDDLGVLVTRDIRGFNKTAIRADDDLPADILALICRLADRYRFPWLNAGRTPTRRQIRESIQATSTLVATQSLQTERRKYGKEIERRLERRLAELGFTKVSTPNKGKVTAPVHYPSYPDFYGECTVHGRKVDLFIALPTGRMIALEAKDSSSALNSVKRLNNDTAAKAKHFAAEGGKNIVNVALLSGVFKVESLVAAQDAGLHLVWAHDMDGFVDWIKSQS